MYRGSHGKLYNNHCPIPPSNVEQASYCDRSFCGVWWCSLRASSSKSSRSYIALTFPSYDTGTIGGILAMDFWLREFSTPGNNGEITPAQDSLIVSILSAGTFFGALLAAPFADILGRRWGLMAAAGIVFNLGVILQTASAAQPMFIAGRFFAGLGVGLISAMSK